MTSFKKNIYSNLVTRIILFLLGIGISVIIARTLGPEGKGIVTFFIMITALIAEYGHLGILNAHAYFFGKKMREEKERVIWNNMSVTLVTSSFWILLIILLSLNGYIFSDVIKALNNNFIVFVFILLVIPILMISVRFVSSLFILNKVILQNKTLLVGQTIFVIILSILLYFQQLSLPSYLVTYFILQLILMIAYFINLRIPFKLAWNKLLIKEEFKFGIKIFFGALFIYLTYRVDIFLIKYFLDFTQVGIYSIGVGIAENLWLIPISVGTVLYARLLNCPDKSNNKVTTFITAKLSFIVCFFLILPLILCAPWLVDMLYGSDFAQSAIITRLLLPGILFAVIGKIMYNYFIAQGKPLVHTAVASIAFITNIVLNFVLIPQYGIQGAAIASTISYIIYGGAYLILITKGERKYSLSRFFWLNKEDFRLIRSLLFQRR